MNIQESAKTTDLKNVVTGRGYVKSTVLLTKLIKLTLAVLGSQHNYITVSTVDIINVMKSYPFNPKCCCVSTFYCS